ncbi:MAG: hypothetical protein EP315_08215, partial [Gammaproteobacteria bacterium]
MTEKATAGTSTLVYPVKFKRSFLKPAYWTTWFAVGFLFVVNQLPASWVDAFANVLGDVARNINRKRRRIARKNLELSFPGLDDADR